MHPVTNHSGSTQHQGHCSLTLNDNRVTRNYMFGQADLVPDREEREGRLGANWPSPHLITSGVRKRTFVTQSVPTTVILLDSLALEILHNYICNMVVSVLGLFCWKSKFWSSLVGQWLGLRPSTAGSPPARELKAATLRQKGKQARREAHKAFWSWSDSISQSLNQTEYVRTSPILPSTEDLPDILEYWERGQEEPFSTSSQNILILWFL